MSGKNDKFPFGAIQSPKQSESKDGVLKPNSSTLPSTANKSN